jgi:hypothetical protein
MGVHLRILLHEECFDMVLAANPSYQMEVSQLVSEPYRG